jgi:hypothetical protein
MDTSGSGLTFLKFTGTKKVGAKWVELSEEELAKQSEKARTWAQLRKLANAGKSDAEPADGDPVDGVGQNEDTPLDARAARLARRAKGASSTESTQTRGLMGRRGRETAREGRQLQPVSAPDAVKETAFGSDFPSSETTARGNHHHLDRSLGRVGNVGENGLERRSDAVPETAKTVAMCADQVQDAAKPHDGPHSGTQPTSEVEYQGKAAQTNTSTVETQPTVSSGRGLSQTGPMKSAPRKTHDAPEAGIQEVSPNSLGLQPIFTNDDDTKTSSAESPSWYQIPRPEACENSMQKGDAVRNGTRLAAQATLSLAEKAVAVETLREPSAEQELSVKGLNTLPSPDDETQVQVHSNATIASANIPQDPDRRPAAKTSIEERSSAGAVIDEAEDALSQDPARISTYVQYQW